MVITESSDSPQDITIQFGRLNQAVVGQIRRLRGRATPSAFDFSIAAWGNVANAEHVAEIVTLTMAGASATEVLMRLRKDVLAYLNDCERVDPVEGRSIRGAIDILEEAIASVIRHA